MESVKPSSMKWKALKEKRERAFLPFSVELTRHAIFFIPYHQLKRKFVDEEMRYHVEIDKLLNRMERFYPEQIFFQSRMS